LEVDNIAKDNPTSYDIIQHPSGDVSAVTAASEDKNPAGC